MGLFSKLRNEFIDIIEWIDDTNHTLVWRFPRYQNEIKNGAQLIVRPGQTAILVHEGKLADVFQPGRYELITANVPILSTLQGWKYGFNSPFKCEVYFISTRQLTDLKWGTPNPIMMRDPDFGPIRLRAFGTYTLKANDAKQLLQELVGTDGVFEAEEVNTLMRSVINSTFADLLGKNQIAALDLAQSYQRLSNDLRVEVVKRIDDEYGLDVPQLFIVNISLPEEVEKALDTRTSMGVIGDLGKFQQFQMGKAMTAAAENPSGGGAATGMGLGMGMAIAQQMAQGMAGTSPGGATPPPPPGGGVYHVCVNNQTLGPVTAQQIEQGIRSGEIGAGTLLWAPGMASWTPASQVAPFNQRFAPPPPPADKS
jgi:membrane protease subunit (stomatin/prohibitin family)